MTESALKNYFDENISLEELKNDMTGTKVQTSHDVFSYYVDTLADGSYHLNENHILKICNEAIQGNLSSSELDIISFVLIGSDFFEWDSERISNTLFDWNNRSINFPITKKNLELWKHYLTTSIYKLPEYNNWNFHIELQKGICNKYDSKWQPFNCKLNIGVGGNLLYEPIHGLRHPASKRTTGWFIWTVNYSDDDNFFEPLCAEHLLQIRPEIIKYLGLSPGFRFLTDNKGYEDVWQDDQLLKI